MLEQEWQVAGAACGVSLPCRDSLYKNKESRSKQGYVGLNESPRKRRGAEGHKNKMGLGTETENPLILKSCLNTITLTLSLFI